MGRAHQPELRVAGPGRGDVSYTELEFETATDLGRPRLVFLVDDDGLPSGQDVERQQAFRRRLQGAGLITVRVSSPVELEARLFQALVELARPPRSRRARITLLAFAVVCAGLAAAGAFVLPRIPGLFAPTVSAGPPNAVIIPGDGTAATPTQADTGACAEHAAAGFEMGVCINDRHVTGELFPDVYVNQQPPDPLACTLTIEVWDGSGHRLLADEGHPCTDGHWVARQVGRVVGGCSPPLHTSVWIETAGRMVRIGDSPAFVYCD